MEPIAFVQSRTLYCADNLERLADFPSECMDLIYLDPPFFSNRNYEVIWGDEAEVRSFEDRWEGGVHVYIDWMRERMFELHRVLKPTGAIYLHCDMHASHYLKVMMDDIFGVEHFQNEIVWCYEIGSRAKKRWGRKHDILLFYSKTDTFYFDWKSVATPRKPGTHMKEGIDEEGRPYQEKTVPKTGKVYRYYLDEGAIPTDWWVGPQQLNREDAERLGFPTQKPEALLERIILASTKKGDLVLDPFCGCGTTIAVAEQLGRQWIGIDISPTAVGLMKRRVEKLGARDIYVTGMPITPAELRDLKPFEFQNWVMQRLNGTASRRKTGDMGIDGFSFMRHDPIQVKQSERVGRNAVDNFETAIERANKDKGYIIAFSFTKGAYEEAARARAQKKLDIRLIRIADLLGPENEPDLGKPDLREMLAGRRAKSLVELPLPKARDKQARPSLEDLIRSDRETATPRA